MSKRKERGGQRLNRELLERARQQAQAIEDETEADETVPDEAPAPSSMPVTVSAESRPVSSGSPRRSSAARIRARNEESRKKALTQDEVAHLLANPTKTVTEEELHAQYGFVLRDLRSMGLLAGASFAVLIVLAFILPH
jgi:hypothetical protein